MKLVYTLAACALVASTGSVCCVLVFMEADSFASEIELAAQLEEPYELPIVNNWVEKATTATRHDRKVYLERAASDARKPEYACFGLVLMFTSIGCAIVCVLHYVEKNR